MELILSRSNFLLTSDEAEASLPELLEEYDFLALVSSSQQDADRAGLQALA